MKYLIKITEEDIKYGIRSSCTSCPIARSLKRSGFKNISVTFSYIRINDDKFIPPPEVIHFMLQYDQYQHVKAFQFHL